MPLLLLLYATTTQALSATTAHVINGSQPYLTFDNGVTKVTTTEGLLGITISDGTTQTTYTPDINTSTASNPIVLPVANQRFIDIDMSVPTNTNSIGLSTLIGAPYNYWGDDDGDGQGAKGIKASGTLKVSITDKENQIVSRSASLDICQAPYKVELTSTAGSLTTRYGVPNSSSFSGGTAIYYISPKATPKICYVRPNRTLDSPQWRGPANIFKPGKGFLVQSTESSTYSRNFPTTGANNLHFDILAGGIDASTLTWPTVTHGGITATMTVNPPVEMYFNHDGASSVRVTFTGPVATVAQINSNSPGSVATPSLPQTFELVGYDSSHTAVLKYGFVLKQWFVNRREKVDIAKNQLSWCANLGGGYRLSKIKDLTNSVCPGAYNCEGAVGATPSSTKNNYQRNIGAGLFTEWGSMYHYDTPDSGFNSYYYWTSEKRTDIYWFYISPIDGYVTSNSNTFNFHAVCAYP